ncbi:sulfurtransferase TusA family protein [Thermodesulfovibrio sp.]
MVHLMCPMHLLKLQELIKKVEPGQIIEIVTDYDGSLEDIPACGEKTGNEFIGVEDDLDFFKFYIRRF